MSEYEKGKVRTGGRKKGTTNKSTLKAREAIAAFVDGNAYRLAGWLDEVAEKDPAEAFKLFQSVIEYNVPKLSRAEHTGLDGGAIEHDVTIETLEDAKKAYTALMKKK